MPPARRLARWVLVATTQCPPEFGAKPSWVIPAGFTVLAAFVAVGAWLPVVAYRLLKPRSTTARALGLVAALCGMLLVWLVGTWIFFNRFVLTC